MLKYIIHFAKNKQNVFFPFSFFKGRHFLAVIRIIGSTSFTLKYAPDKKVKNINLHVPLLLSPIHFPLRLS